MPEVTSRTTARERTTPAAAVKPWMKRRTARIAIDGATRAEQGGADVAREADEQRRPPAARVAHGADQQLAEPEADEGARQRQLDGRRARAERLAQLRKRRQVHVERERAEGGHRAQDHDEAGTRPDGRDPQSGSLRHRVLYACCGRPSTNGGNPLRIDSTSAMRSRNRQRPSGQRTSVSR